MHHFMLFEQPTPQINNAVWTAYQSLQTAMKNYRDTANPQTPQQQQQTVKNNLLQLDKKLAPIIQQILQGQNPDINNLGGPVAQGASAAMQGLNAGMNAATKMTVS